MRHYHIYFEPFVNKNITDEYTGLDMSFDSELLPMNCLYDILNTTLFNEFTFLGSKGWKRVLQKALGIKNIKLEFFKSPKRWMKDGSYDDCKSLRITKRNQKISNNEVQLWVFTQSVKPCKNSKHITSDYVVVDYKSAEFNWNYEFSAYLDSGKEELYGEGIIIDSRKPEPICVKHHSNLFGKSPSTESSLAWAGPLIPDWSFYSFEKIIKNIGWVETPEQILEITPSFSEG